MSIRFSYKTGGILVFMHARLLFATKVFLSVAIVFFLSALFMSFVTFGDGPELNREKISSVVTDVGELVRSGTVSLKSLPGDIVNNSSNETPSVPYTQLIPEDAEERAAIPRQIAVTQEAAVPLAPASAPASLKVVQVLGTASARLAD